MKSKRIIFSILMVVLVSTCFAFVHSTHAGTDVKEIIPELRIKIPDILEGFQEPAFIEECPGGGQSCPDTEKRGYVYIPWIAQYISAIYRYALVLASILSVVAIMIGGILYLTSAGFPSRIKQAKQIIFGALTGLAIIIFSYVFLNLINPELVTLKPIRIQAVKREVLTTGRDCLTVEDPNKVLVQAADGAWYAPTAGNESLFACGTSYPIKSNSADIMIPEGDTCEGSFCQKGGCAVLSGKKQCVEALFTIHIEGISKAFNHYMDIGDGSGETPFEVRGMPGNELVTAANSFSAPDTIVIPKNPATELVMKKYQKLFFHFELNNTACYAHIAYWANQTKGVDLVNVIKTSISKCYLTPSIDNHYYAVKSYKDENRAIWGFPYGDLEQDLVVDHRKTECSPCPVWERDPKTWIFKPLPYCKFWDVQDVINKAETGSGTEVFINLDDFPDLPPLFEGIERALGSFPVSEETKQLYGTLKTSTNPDDWFKAAEQDHSLYPYLKYQPGKIDKQCPNAYGSGYWTDFSLNTTDINALDPMPGTPCTLNELFTERGGMSCRPKTVSTYEWVQTPKSKANEPCDNLDYATNFLGGAVLTIYEKAQQAKTDGKHSQTCDVNLNLNCNYVSGGSSEQCEQAGALYCFGSCQEIGAEALIKPGDPCPGGVCPYYNGKALYCVNNRCYLGKYGDPCVTDNQCTTNFTCKSLYNINACYATNGTAQRWQACPAAGENQHCSGSLECQEPELHGYSANDSDLPICIDQNTDNSDKGVIYCGASSSCSFIDAPGFYPNYQIPWFQDDRADYCTQTQNNLTDAYCSKFVEGAWCKPGTIPTEHQADYYCNEIIPGQIGIIRQKE